MNFDEDFKRLFENHLIFLFNVLTKKKKQLIKYPN